MNRGACAMGPTYPSPPAVTSPTGALRPFFQQHDTPLSAGRHEISCQAPLPPPSLVQHLPAPRSTSHRTPRRSRAEVPRRNEPYGHHFSPQRGSRVTDRRLPHHDAAGLATRNPTSDRHQGRLQRRRLRRLFRYDQRRSGSPRPERLHPVPAPDQRQIRHHRRRACRA